MTLERTKTLNSPRWNTARLRAKELSASYTTPPIPVLEIAESNGVNVVFTTFGDLNDVMAGFCDFEARRLFVNANDPLTRQRFTIAHELGHWVLHRDYYLEHPDLYPVLPRFEKPDNTDPMEKEANAFAATILVPRHLLLPVKNAPVGALAEIFLVSRAMMEFRIKNV